MIGEHAFERSRDRARVERIDEDAGTAENLGQRATIRCDYGHAKRHRLERRQAKAFVERRQDDDRGAAI